MKTNVSSIIVFAAYWMLTTYQNEVSGLQARNQRVESSGLPEAKGCRIGDHCWKKWKWKRQSSLVGSPCTDNLDCHRVDGGAYCDHTKRCSCLSTYVQIYQYCWPKRNLDETCVYNDQCTATCPNSYCSPSGLCTCMNGQKPIVTDDGPVCILPGECPTNSIYPKLRDSSGAAVQCDAPRDCTDSLSISTNGLDDVYYCLCPTANPNAPDCSATPYSYCCPRRALACIQPKDEGHTGGGKSVVQLRWWYNSVTSKCESMIYRGTGGNGNNFQSKAFCETYCKTACPRGNPAYSPSILAHGQQISKCSSDNPCKKTDFQCVERRSEFGMCCPTREFICSPRGGVNDPLEMSPNQGHVSYNTGNWTRYYYQKGQCLPFTYYGIGGNFNNFHTQDECRLFCTKKVCTIGESLQDPRGNPVQCTSGCPSKYTCRSGVCCPSVDFVCSRPKTTGGCSDSIERWWFNPKTRNCEKFPFSGCQGNFNNFPSYDDCMNYCRASSRRITCPHGDQAVDTDGRPVVCSGDSSCPAGYYCHSDGEYRGCCPTKMKTCSTDKMDPGTHCVTPVTRWYYNSGTRQCHVFTYNGCDGNSNNFPTEIDCQTYCNVGGCPHGSTPLLHSTGRYMPCRLGSADCPAGYECSVVHWDDSPNTFCCPSKVYLCSLNADQGRSCGTNVLERHYFDIGTSTCRMFLYKGCGGNLNNFPSFDKCISYCGSADCPPGRVALRDAVTVQLTKCDQSVPDSCPEYGYTCLYSNLFKHGICCGSSAPLGSCQTGKKAYMDPFTNHPVICQPNLDHSCPAESFCQYSNILDTSLCCYDELKEACPSGGPAYLNPFTSQTMRCTPGVSDVCPIGYICQATSLIVKGVLSTVGYCCRETSFQVCPSGSQPHLTQGVPTLCTVGSCPPGYTCDVHLISGSSYCCRPAEQSLPGCPFPYTQLYPVQLCNPSISSSCPPGYFCSLDHSSQQYTCCGRESANVIPNPCPGHLQAYTNAITGQPLACMLGRESTGCPGGYRCRYSRTMNNYYCCR